MNILILGNGFDLAHGLPTKYEDFLEFIDVYEEYKTILKPGEFIESAWRAEKGLRQDYLLYLGNLCDQKNKIFNRLTEMISDNVWINYFQSIRATMQLEGREGWIDFEREISVIVQELDSFHSEMVDNLKNGQKITFLTDYGYEKLEKFFISGEEPDTLAEIASMKDRMLKDLDRLTRALEIYLNDFVNQQRVENTLPEIEKLKVDKVLSFNYTNTYERIYGTANPSIAYAYIHGEAKIEHDKESGRLVLGIDEYLTGDDRNKNTEFIQFKKFFQRIYKKTGSEYIDWLKEYGNNNFETNSGRPGERLNIYIFGHSLDVTDKDVLQRFILNEKDRMYKKEGAITKTTIFYYDHNALGKQIANLVKVIGQDNLISMVHGSDVRIVLQPQQGKTQIEV